MAETTVIGGSVGDISVTVAGGGVGVINPASQSLGNSVDRLVQFVNRQSADPSTSASTTSYMSTFGMGDDSFSARSLDVGPQADDGSDSPFASLGATTLTGKGSSTLVMQGVVPDGSPISQQIIDSSDGGNKVSIDKGVATLGQSVGDTISALAGLVVQGGVNSHVNSLGGHLDFIDGVGTSYISAHDAMIFGTTGSVYHFTGTSPSKVLGDDSSGSYSTFSGSMDSSGNAVHNILFDASSSHGAFAATVGDKDTIIGGAASDTFYIDSSTTASGNAGDVSATLTGGSGAANLFQFMDNEGGHYTITDFGSAAGNLVAFSGTQQDLMDTLKNATIEGGNTTIRLKDNTEITFLNDTHLKNTDFKLIPSS
ncbi:hypothetical protein PT277_00460 [Acetobacteraceae bacterium ESL0709]|nr:hypothetical protein [Acetobacteraceae bacterium ESL0697]MDF7677191.1 hypothetical protein [Acetobacteraceae bacterium ESL0709]